MYYNNDVCQSCIQWLNACKQSTHCIIHFSQGFFCNNTRLNELNPHWSYPYRGTLPLSQRTNNPYCNLRWYQSSRVILCHCTLSLVAKTRHCADVCNYFTLKSFRHLVPTVLLPAVEHRSCRHNAVNPVLKAAKCSQCNESASLTVVFANDSAVVQPHRMLSTILLNTSQRLCRT